MKNDHKKPEIETEWMKEAQRRLSEYEKRNLKTVLGDQFHQELREKYWGDENN